MVTFLTDCIFVGYECVTSFLHAPEYIWFVHLQQILLKKSIQDQHLFIYDLFFNQMASSLDVISSKLRK